MKKRLPHREFLKTLPLSIRVDEMHVQEWLWSVQAYRREMPLDERSDALLWSWPVRRALTPASPPKPWSFRPPYDDDRLALGARLSEDLTRLAQDWYPFSFSMRNATFWQRCRELHSRLVDLNAAPESVPNVERFLAEQVLEPHYGDGEYEARRTQLIDARKRMKKEVWLNVVHVLEHARDQAYQAARINRQLDAIRTTKQTFKAFTDWLQQARQLEGFVHTYIRPIADNARRGEDLPPGVYQEDIQEFHDAFRTICDRPGIRKFLNNSLRHEVVQEGRTRRAHPGNPPKTWVQSAQATLAKWGLTRPLQRELFQACALLHPEKA